MNDIVCIKCGSIDVQKFGVTKAGLQKYRCRREACRRQFVLGSTHNIPSAVKEKVLILLSEKVDPHIIHKTYADQISLRWIFQLRRRLRKQA